MRVAFHNIDTLYLYSIYILRELCEDIESLSVSTAPDGASKAAGVLQREKGRRL